MRWHWPSFTVSGPIPRLRQWPLILTKVGAFGAAFGIGISSLVNLSEGNTFSWAHIPKFLLVSAVIGSIFSLSFYITCGIPGMVLPRLMADFPERRRRILMGIAGSINASLGLSVAVWLVTRIPLGFPIHILGQNHIEIVIIVNAILGGIISTIIMVIMHARREERRAKEQLLEARFTALQSQINPHFLFNTLNSISALIPRRPEAAQDMVSQLADMFRYALDSQFAMVTLDQELDFVRHYLALEQIRFPDRLRAELPDGSFAGVRLPGLTLQPLVENAIRYGVAQRLEGGIVQLSVQLLDNNRCVVEVRNQYDESMAPDLSPGRLFRQGHALNNIRERLRIHWSERSRLELTEKDGWVTTLIEFPVKGA